MIKIYKITNKVNGTPYIGQTFMGIYKRWLHHCCVARQKNPRSTIGYMIKKFKPENFTIKILRSFTNQRYANVAEMNTIKYWKSRGLTYNQSNGGINGGGSKKGWRHSKETKNKMSLRHQGKYHTDETKLKMSISHKGMKNFLGKHHSEETKQKLSISSAKRFGWFHTKKTKQKMKLAACKRRRITSWDWYNWRGLLQSKN